MSTLDNTDLSTITRGVPADRNDEHVPSQPSKSTSWRHARGRPTRRDKAVSQQYLTPSEEKAVLEYVLLMYERGYPLPVKFLGSIAHNIKRQPFLRLPNPYSRRRYSTAGQELGARHQEASP